jgi:hypothetical protein
MNKRLVKLIALFTVVAFFVTSIGMIGYSILSQGW